MPSSGDSPSAPLARASRAGAPLLAALLATACSTPAPPREGPLSPLPSSNAAAAGASAPAPGASASPPAIPSSSSDARPSPPWPTSPDPPPPAGFSWRTVRHETIHARLLVPDGARVESTRDVHGYPRVDVDVDGELVILQFDSGVVNLGVTLAKKPPMVYSMPAEKALVTPDTLAARYRTSSGSLRISGFAPGVKCLYDPFREAPARTLDRVYTVCSSLRSPAPGPWRASTREERANGGMTDVPEGAWVEGALPATPGSLLRPGRFAARMHLGGLVVMGARCPPSAEPLREKQPNEVEVTVEERKKPTGQAWIRRATDSYLGGDRYPGTTNVIVRVGERCCRAQFVPWTSPPSAAQVDYAQALCETFRPD